MELLANLLYYLQYYLQFLYVLSQQFISFDHEIYCDFVNLL